MDDPRKRETEALIEAIWGPQATGTSYLAHDPASRARQNQALAAAMRAYLTEYLAEIETPRPLDA